MRPDPAPYDVCGPLPSGTTVLEASAGTGKTFTIAALAARYVAEGRAELSQLMLVTFSRAATQELRERVRERLVGAERGLADPAAARDADDEVLRLLAGAPDDEVARRHRRLAAALSGFDAATIATTHGFCQQMLAGLGTAGDRDPAATFLESADDLVQEVVDDLYLRKYSPSGAAPPAMKPATARKVARSALQDAQARLLPADATPGSEAQERYGLACAVRAEVDRRKRERRLIDYDDLLTRLRDALVDPVRGAAACERLQSRYRVVLVDEFQDTDPVQWQILRTAFHGHTTLVLIGDPKQAVYAFRGADLVTYLAAARDAGTQRTLARNWRSDAGLVAAVDAVMGRAALGAPEVVVRPVQAAHAGPRLRAAPSSAALRVRVMRRPEGKGRYDNVGEIRRAVAHDLAADVVELLRSGARIDGRDTPLGPGDVAVLVRTNDQAVLVRDALDAARVPAVLTGSRSVFLTEPAREWLVLLRAVEQPHRTGLVRAAALTRFVGWTAAQLDAAGDAGVDELAARMRTWRDVLSGRGVAALLHVIGATERLAERLLARPSGERDLTDVRHVAETLHAAAVGAQLGPSSLVEWLDRRIAEAEVDTLDERSRRLESDAAAVQVVTIHSAKGLEFPIVYVPYAWNRRKGRAPDPLRLHGPHGERLLDVGGPGGSGWGERARLHWAEEDGEELRLLYVALTRAQCQAVVWWAPSANTDTSPLHRLVFGELDSDNQPPAAVPVPSSARVRSRLGELAERCPSLRVEVVQDREIRAWTPPRVRSASLEVARFDRALDRAWRRTSYTALTAALHVGVPLPDGVGSEPEEPERRDEPDVAPLRAVASDTARAQAAETALRELALPMARLPAGTAFGTLVHTVLESVDTSVPDVAAEVRRAVDAALARRPLAVDPVELTASLSAVLATPLGPLAGGRTLGEVAPRDRLTELEFELPLAGGEAPVETAADLRGIAALVRRHLPPGDPLAAVADRLDALPAERLRAYLTGSIDAVLRLPAAGGDPRHVVVDYKTNLLGPADELTAWHYRPSALAESMVSSGYPLQALLYSVALHRFLRWRLPGYDEGRHLGGVLYLYVRGMVGSGTPLVDGVPCGIVSWRPPTALITELSDLLAGEAQ